MLFFDEVNHNHKSETAFENKYDYQAFLKAILNLSLTWNVSTLESTNALHAIFLREADTLKCKNLLSFTLNIKRNIPVRNGRKWSAFK